MFVMNSVPLSFSLVLTSQSWANGELNQAASYPSPYAFVHKGSLGKMGGSIGPSDSDTWKPPTMEKRREYLKKLQTFKASLGSSLSHVKRHDRQMVYPRIGEYADRRRPEPGLNKINARQHLLNCIYQQALRGDIVEVFWKF